MRNTTAKAAEDSGFGEGVTLGNAFSRVMGWEPPCTWTGRVWDEESTHKDMMSLLRTSTVKSRSNSGRQQGLRHPAPCRLHAGEDGDYQCTTHRMTAMAGGKISEHRQGGRWLSSDTNRPFTLRRSDGKESTGPRYREVLRQTRGTPEKFTVSSAS